MKCVCRAVVVVVVVEGGLSLGVLFRLKGHFSQEKTHCFVELQWFLGVGEGGWEWEEGFGWL